MPVDPTSTSVFPTFASKAELLTWIKENLTHIQPDRAYELLARLSNTDTSTFADPTETEYAGTY